MAEHCAEKLIRRHPHVFGEAEVADAAEVLRNWDAIKREEPGRERGPFGDVPENLPGLLHARKVQRRAASGGFDFPDAQAPLASLREELDELEAAAEQPPGPQTAAAAGESAHPQAFHELGDVLFAAVSVARKLKLDPELALRAATERFRGRVQAAIDHAERAGETWSALDPDRQLNHYDAARRPAVRGRHREE